MEQVRKGVATMMGKTHITVGVAVAMAITMPTTPAGLYTAVIGGAVSGVLCDIECKSEPGMRDALIARVITAGITIILLLTDWLTNAGIVSSILSQDQSSLILGAVVLLITCFFGRRSNHRTFTHSLLYVLLISFGMFCIYPEFRFPVLAGGLSHLIIDTFNKKPVPWLYPFFRHGFCLKWCYASKKANTVLMWVGLALDIVLIGLSVVCII